MHNIHGVSTHANQRGVNIVFGYIDFLHLSGEGQQFVESGELVSWSCKGLPLVSIGSNMTSTASNRQEPAYRDSVA